MTKWENLSKEMKNEAVKKYYEVLSKKQFSLILKRIFDITVSLIVCIVLMPVFIVVAILIKLTSPGPVFYRQTRITTYYKPFKILKFRTMQQNAEKIGPLVTKAHDERITKIGNFLRKTRIDETPQAFNILLGHMSFVGTRPEVEQYVKAYSDEMKATLLMPAGVTSLASINFKDESEILKNFDDIDKGYIDAVLPKKMQYNLAYIKNFNFFYDIKIMFKTLLAVAKQQ